ncbi:MAG: asparagine synthase-related protein [Gemmatimonadaceae bacterium]
MTGDIRTWRRLLKEGGYRTWQERLRWGLLPLLPNVMWRTLDAFRARPLQRPFTQDLPSWLTKRASGRLTELGWTRAEVSRGLFEGPASYESRWYLTAPYMSRATSWTHDVAQQCQVELRSPILDKRVVEFAASRPLLERASVSETKPLLRAAMQGLLPESVLAPRSYKTGVPRGYLGRQIQRGLDGAMERLLLGDTVRSTWVLADLGVINVAQLNEQVLAYRTTQDHLTGVQIFLTLEAEFWLRTHDWSSPTAW